MQTAEEVMTAKVVTLTEGVPLAEAAATLKASKVGGAPVVDAEGRVCGILSESDIVRVLKKQVEAADKLEHVGERERWDEGSSALRQVLEFVSLDWFWYLWNSHSAQAVFKNLQESEALQNAHVGDVMTKDVITVGRGAPLREVIELMNRFNINRIPVVDDKKNLLGIVTRGDLLKSIAGMAKVKDK